MRKAIVSFAFICTTVHLFAQEPTCSDSIHTEFDAFSITKSKNILVLRNSTVEDLAFFLNTSKKIAHQLISFDKLNDTMLLRKGDSIVIDFGQKLIPEKISSLVGKIISWRLNDNLSKYFFSNFWNGNGNIELSHQQFAGILICLKEKNTCIKFISDTLMKEREIRPYVISLYNTHYEKSFGYATIFIDSNNRIVGFYDKYDFNPMTWGVRSFKYEIITRFISLVSPASSSDYEIFYGATTVY